MLRYLTLLCLLAFPAVAQTTGSLFLELGDYSQLGYVRPLWGVGVSVEHSTPRLLVTAAIDWSPDHKQASRVVVAPFAPEWSATAGVRGYARLGPVLVGGGPAYSITRTSAYTKDVLRWDVAAGAEVPVDRTRVRLLASHTFAGSDRSNDLTGETYSFRVAVPWGKRMEHRLGGALGFWRFHESNHPDGQRFHARAYLFTVGEAF